MAWAIASGCSHCRGSGTALREQPSEKMTSAVLAEPGARSGRTRFGVALLPPTVHEEPPK
ncbi:MAG: hypothetical protein IPG04_10055 [Polyangiaceae bacterium]|nr:hypothetical protein [Polyangiaceae bacterium]